MATQEERILDMATKITSLEILTRNNADKIEKIDKLTDAVHETAINFTKLVATVAQQSKDLTVLVRSLERHDARIEGIEKSMGTKETVQELCNKVEFIQEELQASKNDIFNKKLNAYDDAKKFIAKTLFGSLFFVVSALVIFAVIILMSLAKTGALP